MNWQTDGPAPGEPPQSDLERRSFLKLLAGSGVLLAAGPRLASAAPFQGGAGTSTDAYLATQRAIAACGQWPAASVAGRTVVIKPNLVGAAPASSGITTDPQAVRAVVDQALAAGAAQ